MNLRSSADRPPSYCPDTPPSPPEPEEEEELHGRGGGGFSGGFDNHDEGGFIEGGAEPSDDRHGMVLQHPTPDFPTWRIVPAGGFVAEKAKASLEAVTAGCQASSAAPAESLSCRECGGGKYNQKYSEKFNVVVCNTCIKAKEELYDLVTKTNAKEEFVLGDKDLEDLGFITRKNPRKEGWQEMKLYLRLQVAQQALHRYDSLEGIDQARQRHQQGAAERKRKREGKESVLRSAQQGSERTPEMALADDGSLGLLGKGALKPKGRACERVAQAVAKRHTHEWGAEWQDQASGAWRHRCIDCSTVVSFVKI